MARKGSTIGVLPKTCSKCGASEEKDFYPSIWGLPGRARWCRRCMVAGQVKRLREVPGVREDHKSRLRNTRDRRIDWWRNVRDGLVCKICGESRPACLDFHHRDPTTKEFQVSWALSQGYSIPRLLAEMAKCDVICANCHRCQHHDESFAQRRSAPAARKHKRQIPV